MSEDIRKTIIEISNRVVRISKTLPRINLNDYAKQHPAPKWEKMYEQINKKT